MYDRVLVPTDGSDAATAAVEHALALARRFGASLHALYVVDVRVSEATGVSGGQAIEPAIDALEEAGETAVADVRERAERTDVEATGDVVNGTPASAIIEAAADGDVIVMGTHGRTGLDRYLVGSTTEKVVRTAEVPVLTVPVADASADESTEAG